MSRAAPLAVLFGLVLIAGALVAVEELTDDGTASPAETVLGVSLVEAEGEVTVAELVSPPRAVGLGLMAGDVIFEIDDESVESVDQVLGKLEEVRPGGRLSISVARNGHRLYLNLVVLGQP